MDLNLSLGYPSSAPPVLSLNLGSDLALGSPGISMASLPAAPGSTAPEIALPYAPSCFSFVSFPDNPLRPPSAFAGNPIQIYPPEFSSFSGVQPSPAESAFFPGVLGSHRGSDPAPAPGDLLLPVDLNEDFMAVQDGSDVLLRQWQAYHLALSMIPEDREENHLWGAVFAGDDDSSSIRRVLNPECNLRRLTTDASTEIAGKNEADDEALPGEELPAGGALDFDCNICLELAKEPVVTPCGHLFCWPCLYQWLRLHCHYSECPVCKGDVREASLVPIYGRGSSGNRTEEIQDADSGLRIPPRPRGRRSENWWQRFRRPLTRRFSPEFAIPRHERTNPAPPRASSPARGENSGFDHRQGIAVTDFWAPPIAGGGGGEDGGSDSSVAGAPLRGGLIFRAPAASAGGGFHEDAGFEDMVGEPHTAGSSRSTIVRRRGAGSLQGGVGCRLLRPSSFKRRLN